MPDLAKRRRTANLHRRLALGLLLAALVAGCSSQRPAMRPQPGAQAEPAAEPGAEATPRAKTSRRAAQKRQRKAELGEASFYHPSLEGNLTASGVPYRAEALTCAHRTLPFGTHLRVTRLDEARSVSVVVNDRGPFVAGRIIDLSMAAARKLGMVEKGHVPVRLEVTRLPSKPGRAALGR
ncbi:MAG TPA: septal ring lytic transglycosylase RlpA family lipoprotein [Myxococcales bacterium]|nr:septal ring lytic transglycosylase RlpA family lipoprotein [Myxococcales bacterium]